MNGLPDRRTKLHHGSAKTGTRSAAIRDGLRSGWGQQLNSDARLERRWTGEVATAVVIALLAGSRRRECARAGFSRRKAGVRSGDRQAGGAGRGAHPRDTGTGQPISSAASRRSCWASGLRSSLLVHGRSGAMAAAAGTGQGAVQTGRGRKRAAADAKLTGRITMAWTG